MKRYSLIFGLLLLTGFSLWASGATDIADIQANPRNYVGKMVTINGEVTKVSKVPFTDFQIQTVYDRSATMPVLTMITRQVGDPFASGIEIIGVNTEDAEDSSSNWASNLADIIIEQEWMTTEEAINFADKLYRFLVTLFRGMDISLMGIEKETAGRGTTGKTV